MDESELIKKYGIDIESLKKEQIKLNKEIVLKDSQDFSLATRFAAIENILVKNNIVSGVIVCDKDFNILEQQYFLDKIKFPYLHEFRSYRELPAMLEAFNKLNEKPDIVFVHGHGLTHPRLGLASHFSLIAGVPTISIADTLFEGDNVEADNVVRQGKTIGRVLQTKDKANPLYISVGNGISIDTCYKLAKQFINPPHKLPEPLHLAHKYVKSVKDELKL